MTTQPTTEPHPTPTNIDTERLLQSFVRNAVVQLSEALNRTASDFAEDARFERGEDGHFRERKKLVRTLWHTLNDEWLSLLPEYQMCKESLGSNELVGSHLDRTVGTVISASRLEANSILKALIYAMLDDAGTLVFSEERFRLKWQEMLGLFGAHQIAFKTVAPLPYLALPSFPLQLSKELVLDRLTDDEVTRCNQVGVLSPISPRFPLIYGDVAVGLRKTTLLPKLIGDQAHALQEPASEGNFGNRPTLRDDLVVDDVLSALRLFKRTQIRTLGHASWTDSYWLGSGTSFRLLGQWPYGGKFELSEAEVPNFLEMWHLLTDGTPRFDFCIHRFNLAFERRLLADRIVDLVIAAEALFLGDLDDKYRGELRFRFALRAGKFIEHPKYPEHDVFRLMRQAYDARSAIVHGGSPKETRLPDNKSADLPTFIDVIEDLVRLGLRKALSMKNDGSKLRQAEYWDSLVFPNPATTDE